jgi:hypothetical protein
MAESAVLALGVVRCVDQVRYWSDAVPHQIQPVEAQSAS